MIGLTVQAAPSDVIAVSTRYADGRAGTYGGSGYGAADPSGTYHFTWTVSPNAPAGTATVTIGVSGPNGGSYSDRQASFRVAARC